MTTVLRKFFREAHLGLYYDEDDGTRVPFSSIEIVQDNAACSPRYRTHAYAANSNAPVGRWDSSPCSSQLRRTGDASPQPPTRIRDTAFHSPRLPQRQESFSNVKRYKGHSRRNQGATERRLPTLFKNLDEPAQV